MQLNQCIEGKDSFKYIYKEKRKTEDQLYKIST